MAGEAQESSSANRSSPPVGRPLAEEFVPSTFAERGVTVPFTTPLMAQARMRQDTKGKFEFLLPNFTGGRGVYVLSWKSLPSVITLTLHDRLLMEQMETIESHSPETVRRATLAVQSTGVAGPEAAEAAEKALAAEQQYLVLTQFILVTELLKLVGIGAQDLLRPGMTADDSKKLARHSLGRVAAMADMPPDEMSTRVEGLGTAVASVGLPQCPQPGRLRDLAAKLATFCDSAETWAEQDLSDAGPLGRYVAQVGRHTLALARQRISLLDRACAEPKQIIHDEPKLRGAILEQVGRISWLLDGWEYLIALWGSVFDQPLSMQQETMAEISRLVPVLPKEEVVWIADGLDMDLIARVQRRWVRLNEDWRTGALDMGAVMRIEALKTDMVKVE